MSENLNIGDGCCCRPSNSGLRMLTFPDGSKVGITGLDAALEDIYREGKSLNRTTGQELMERLKRQNYLAPSARQTYEELFLSEYKMFLESKLESREKENETMASQDDQNNKKKGIFNMFKSNKKTANEGGCCNMKIVSKEQAAKDSNQGCCCNMKIVPKEQAAEDKSAKK